MLLLKPCACREIIKAYSNTVLRKSVKCRTYTWNTFSVNSHGILTSEKSFDKLISCKYSNEISEFTEEMLCDVTDMKRQSAQTTEAVFAKIANGDSQVLRKLKLLEFEIEVYRQTNVNMPDLIKQKDWEHLLTLNSLFARKKYLTFLFKIEKKSINRMEKKRLRREEYLKFKEEESNTDPFSYNLSNQCLFLRIYSKTMNQLLPFRNVLSEEIAQHVVFDCSYQEYMSSMNTKYCAMQLLYCLNLNLFHHYPSYIRFCNFKKSDELSSTLPKYIPNVYEDDFPWPIHEESYLDIYPKEKLVYLTPHCTEPLMKPNPGDVYIIGAFVDKGCGVKASLARAKKDKLRMAKFPLDEFIKWKQGTKSLPLNIVLKILLDMKFYNDWTIALKNIPIRHYGLINVDMQETSKGDIIV